MVRFYTNLIVLDRSKPAPLFCRGRGWSISFESNSACGFVTKNTGDPAIEIVIEANSKERAQNVLDLILAAHCLYTTEVIFCEYIPVLERHPQTSTEIERSILAGENQTFGMDDLPIACQIASKASHKLAYQYALFKYLMSCRIITRSIQDLDPAGNLIPHKGVSILRRDHVDFSVAIVLAYAVLEELSLNVPASKNNPSKIKNQWNPKVKQELEKHLKALNIDLLERIVWHQRGTPTRIENKKKPIVLSSCEWSTQKVRDIYVDIFEAIAYSSWLRSKVSAHTLKPLAHSLTIYDVTNVQHLARRFLLEAFGFWRYLHQHKGSPGLVSRL